MKSLKSFIVCGDCMTNDATNTCCGTCFRLDDPFSPDCANRNCDCHTTKREEWETEFYREFVSSLELGDMASADGVALKIIQFIRRTSLWIGEEKRVVPTHIAFRAKSRKAVHDFYELRRELESIGAEDGDTPRLYVYSYNTKNGGHIITQPFPYPHLLQQKWHPMLKKNAMMLWSY